MHRYIFLLPFLFSSLVATPVDSPYLMQSPLLDKHVLLHNRVLARINGKSFSLVDVIKKLNILLYQRDKGAFSDPNALLQFYQGHWKEALEELINEQLILLEATEANIHISEGEIRQEIEKRFGPNVVASLAKLQLTYDEAKTFVKNDFTIQQIRFFKVNTKALQSVTPEKIKQEYTAFLAANPPKDKFTYRVVTLRPQEELQEVAFNKLQESLAALSELSESSLEALKGSSGVSLQCSLSQPLTSVASELSDEHKAIFSSLEEGKLSPLQKQWSRQTNTNVLRAYQLIEKTTLRPPPFEQLYDAINDKLLSRYYHEELRKYVEHLRSKYHISKETGSYLVPEQYIPFEIIQ